MHGALGENARGQKHRLPYAALFPGLFPRVKTPAFDGIAAQKAACGMHHEDDVLASVDQGLDLLPDAADICLQVFIGGRYFACAGERDAQGGVIVQRGLQGCGNGGEDSGAFPKAWDEDYGGLYHSC